MITGFMSFCGGESFAATIIVPPTCAAPTANTVLEPNWLNGTVVHVMEGPLVRTADPLAVGVGTGDRLGIGVALGAG